jgi:hypothetical protein
MMFYLIGPTMGYGTVKEPLIAIGVAGVWGLYGAVYFLRASKAKGKTVLLDKRTEIA